MKTNISTKFSVSKKLTETYGKGWSEKHLRHCLHIVEIFPIHFNWRLIKSPMTVIEYIIVHELTHLLESNHNQDFWNRVAAQLPNYDKAKYWLKEYGYELERDF
jgi:hypothetical protein